MATLIPAFLPLCIHAITQAANQVAAVRNHAETGRELQLLFTLNRKKCDLSEFKCVVVISARQTGLISHS